MTLWEALILGIVQGITEFLPISSSAHLVIVQTLMGLSIPGLTFEIFLHLASLLAVIIYFRTDLVDIIKGFFQYLLKQDSSQRLNFTFALYIILATLITGVLGILMEKTLGQTIKSPILSSVNLIITGIFLILIERVINDNKGRDVSQMTFRDAIIVGLAQTLAVLPGISRSGSTLVAALWTGLDKETAVRFSFLLSIPVILGSSILMFGDIQGSFFQGQELELALSFVASFFFALLGIKWLIAFLNQSKLIYFAIYCFILGAIGLVIF